MEREHESSVVFSWMEGLLYAVVGYINVYVSRDSACLDENPYKGDMMHGI